MERTYAQVCGNPQRQKPGRAAGERCRRRPFCSTTPEQPPGFPAARMSLLDISRRLGAACDAIAIGDHVHSVYNPLTYAWRPHAAYLERYGAGPKRFLWLGMNPGPFGMGQTGVPFGDVPSVRDWMGIEEPVEVPPNTHPKRPIVGFALKRREGSGKRLWGWAAERFGDAEAFFDQHFVHNYCPLFFVHESGRNIVPEKLHKHERAEIEQRCDAALREVIEHLGVAHIVAVGAFAERRATEAMADGGIELPVTRILHPSPASPAANRGWAEQVESVLEGIGALDGARSGAT